jgi:uncharacterized membrane protein (DUF4010 family)
LTIDFAGVMGLAVATLGGAAVGLERQWSGHADGPVPRFGGLRTFTLLGGAAGMAGLFWTHGYVGPATALVATLGALIVAAYVAAGRHDVDATTEFAAVVVLAAALLSGIGETQLGSGIFALTSLVLLEKPRLHRMVSRLDDVGLRAAVRFGVMSVVVLPLLPEGPLGPLGLRPRAVWLLVLFFSGVSFAGYLARRITGDARGYWLTGLFGGLVSSTQVTLTFARFSRSETTAAAALATGAIAANAVLYPRVLLAASVINPALAFDLAVRLAGPFLVACALLALMVRRPGEAVEQDVPVTNPLQLSAALQMAAMFQIVLLAVEVVARRWGNAGILPTAAVLGATDVDALTMSMAKLSQDAVAPVAAAQAIGVGILVNTVVKSLIAVIVGHARFRIVAGATLAAMAGVLLLTLLALSG